MTDKEAQLRQDVATYIGALILTFSRMSEGGISEEEGRLESREIMTHFLAGESDQLVDRMMESARLMGMEEEEK